FTLKEMMSKLAVDWGSKAGAKFDWEKGRWFNGEWIKAFDSSSLAPKGKDILTACGVECIAGKYRDVVLCLVKERPAFLDDFWTQASFFFVRPLQYDADAIKPKWSADKTKFFENIEEEFGRLDEWSAQHIEPSFKEKIASSGLKVGELMLPFRVMLVGGKFGPDVFKIAELLGKDETIARIKTALPYFSA